MQAVLDPIQIKCAEAACQMFVLSQEVTKQFTDPNLSVQLTHSIVSPALCHAADLTTTYDTSWITHRALGQNDILNALPKSQV